MRWTAVAAVALVVAGCSGPEEDRGEPVSEGASQHYLSLGDSLTVGVQPDQNGSVVETDESFTDVLYEDLREDDPSLVHERLGCGGEDTTTFIEGGLPLCEERYEAGSQLDQAEEYLEEHGDQVSLITLTIGANNFTDCVTGVRPGAAPRLEAAGVDEECVAEGMDRLESEVPEIAERLGDAAGEDTQIIGMTYYNPFLALALLDGLRSLDAPTAGAEDLSEDAPEEAVEEASHTGLAARSVEVMDEFNDALAAAYEAAGVEVAEVDAAFHNTDTEAAEGQGEVPVNVATICELTWMCDTVRGPDIHTNAAGAQRIAEAFEARVR
ncbi:GDSL-type esterase/lipase family protein [Nocardiopsis sp. MG754419]|uniref:GDSL-type esterase/lipase family protein n=1 Tax=Nocardiopsis sp. MG754419 TaxID=2259865 RepID=UPI001BA733F6|nr:GDSL-type esterase/lipase family protein [Nocardiopsis sp. MG754419]